MFHSFEKSILSGTNPVLRIEKFPSLVPPEIRSLICRVIALREVKNKRKSQTFSSKSGRRRLLEVVTYKRFKSRDLTWIRLLFCKNGRWEEVADYKRRSQPEVRSLDCRWSTVSKTYRVSGLAAMKFLCQTYFHVITKPFLAILFKQQVWARCQLVDVDRNGTAWWHQLIRCRWEKTC